MMGGTQYDSEFAEDIIAFVSLVVSFIAESPMGSKLPFSNLIVCSGSKAREVVGAVNPSKTKSPRMPET